MNIPLRAVNNHTTEHLLELALAMLDDARREQNNVQLPANNWLTNNFTLEIIRGEGGSQQGQRCHQRLGERDIAAIRTSPSAAMDLPRDVIGDAKPRQGPFGLNALDGKVAPMMLGQVPEILDGSDGRRRKQK
jgi:hypothetical protein